MLFEQYFAGLNTWSTYEQSLTFPAGDRPVTTKCCAGCSVFYVIMLCACCRSGEGVS